MSSGDDQKPPVEAGEGGESAETYPEEHHEPVDPDDLLWSGGAHKKKKKKKRKPLPGETISHLNLTPMMDIMTMLLVFLVMNFATEPNNITLSDGMQPPQSTSKQVLKPSTKVIISSKALFVDDELVLNLEHLQGQGAAIPEVKDALVKAREFIKASAAVTGKQFDGTLLVVADEGTQYSLITAVLVTAGEAQYTTFQLVLKPKEGKAG